MTRDNTRNKISTTVLYVSGLLLFLRGELMVVVERVDPAESITKLGLIKVRVRDS